MTRTVLAGFQRDWQTLHIGPQMSVDLLLELRTHGAIHKLRMSSKRESRVMKSIADVTSDSEFSFKTSCVPRWSFYGNKHDTVNSYSRRAHAECGRSDFKKRTFLTKSVTERTVKCNARRECEILRRYLRFDLIGLVPMESLKSYGVDN